MGTWLTPNTYHASASNPFVWQTDTGHNDAGFMYFQQVLRSGSQSDCTAVAATWNYCCLDLVHVINGLYKAYSRISQTWTGAAADAFYAEMARVQNFAYAMLQNISSQQQGMTLISSALASSSQAGSVPATATAGGVPTLQQVSSGCAVLNEATGYIGSTSGQPPAGGPAGSTTIPSSIIDVLNDCAQVIATGSNLAGKTLADPYSGNPITGASAEVVLAGWMCGQAWNDGPPITLEFYSGLVGFAVAAIIAPEIVATMEAIVAIAAALNTPFGQAIGSLELNSFVGQVLMETLTWHAGQTPGPAQYTTALARAWTTNAQALPDPLDPSQTTSGTSPNNGQNTPTNPGYTPTTTPNTSAFQPPKTSTTGAGNPNLGTGTGTGTGPGTGTGYTPSAYDPSGIGTSPYSGLGTGSGLGSGGGSLASFNPNGLGTDGLATGGGLGGAGAAGDPAGAGSALSGAGSAGRGMPMMPGGGAGGNKDGKDRNRNVYLPEEEDVWGANGDVSDGVL